MVLTTTSKPTFLPWSLLDYLSHYYAATLYDHKFMYVGLFVHSPVVFHVFSCFYALRPKYMGQTDRRTDGQIVALRVPL